MAIDRFSFLGCNDVIFVSSEIALWFHKKNVIHFFKLYCTTVGSRQFLFIFIYLLCISAT